jgi:hypothetical protein
MHAPYSLQSAQCFDQCFEAGGALRWGLDIVEGLFCEWAKLF